jgi:hypothetical protein
MRNEMHFRLKELHRLVQYLRFFTSKGSEIPLPCGSRRSGRVLSSQITDEIQLVAHPVGELNPRDEGDQGNKLSRSRRSAIIREFAYERGFYAQAESYHGMTHALKK